MARNEEILFPLGEMLGILLHDELPPTLDAILLHTEPGGNEPALIKIAASLVQSGMAARIVIDGLNSTRLNTGTRVKDAKRLYEKSWQQAFEKVGIASKVVAVSPHVARLQEQTDAFGDMIREYRWKSVGVLADACLLPRCMLHQFGTMRRHQHNVSLYAIPCVGRQHLGTQGPLASVQQYYEEVTKTMLDVLNGMLPTPIAFLKYLEEEREQVLG